MYKFKVSRLLTSLNVIKNEFIQIDNRFYQRKNGNSSGERILISFMRAIASWDKNVSILVVDECTAFLDSLIKKLFFSSLSELSTHNSIYLTG